MSHTAFIWGQDLGGWTATLPDGVTFHQGQTVSTDPGAVFRLDNDPNNPLLIRVHYDPAALFGQPHGILSINFAEHIDPDFVARPGYYDNTGNGLRGIIYIEFYNDLGVPLQSPIGGLSGGGGTLAYFLGGETDVITSPAYTTPFHTPYAHFHAAAPPGSTAPPTLEQDFHPDAIVRGQVGPPFAGPQGNPTGAPNWILIAKDVPVGNVTTGGPLALHQRDLSPAADNFSLNVMLLDGALTPQDLLTVQAAYNAAHSDTNPIA